MCPCTTLSIILSLKRFGCGKEIEKIDWEDLPLEELCRLGNFVEGWKEKQEVECPGSRDGKLERGKESASGGDESERGKEPDSGNKGSERESGDDKGSGSENEEEADMIGGECISNEGSEGYNSANDELLLCDLGRREESSKEETLGNTRAIKRELNGPGEKK